MSRKRGFDWSLPQTISLLSREATELNVQGFGNPKASQSVLEHAIKYLSEHQASKDAESVADFDLAEVGAIIRRQRETITRLESTIAEYRDWAHAADSEANRCKDELRKLGAL